MELSPQSVRTIEFRTVKRGLDADEVSSFLRDVADELERAQNQATAMEARARAAIQRVQELSAADGSPPSGTPAPSAASPSPASVAASVDESETISRTLLLAQRTADTTVAEAEAAAATLLAEAEQRAADLAEEAREAVRREGEAERVAVAREAESLALRRDSLIGDVEHLEQFLVAQRERLRDAATTMLDLTERIPGGLGPVAPPLLETTDDGDAAEASGEPMDGASTDAASDSADAAAAASSAAAASDVGTSAEGAVGADPTLSVAVDDTRDDVDADDELWTEDGGGMDPEPQWMDEPPSGGGDDTTVIDVDPSGPDDPTPVGRRAPAPDDSADNGDHTLGSADDR